MTVDTIAVLMPGDMGHAVGRTLHEHGHDMVTCLAGRSAATRLLADRVGLRDLPDLAAVVRQADLILSILPPARAVAQAEAVAAAMQASGAAPVFVDCNAVSPETVGQAAALIEAAGAPFIDCGIIGLAPGKGPAPRFYVSGRDTAPMQGLDGKGIEVLSLGPEVGRASGLKMCYAGLTKGTWTLHTAVLLAAEALDLRDPLTAELTASQQGALAAMRDRVPKLPADSQRWIGEMEEIAATFAAAGVPSDFHQGAAEIFRLLSRTPFAAETRETMDQGRTLEEALPVYAAQLRLPACK